MRSANRQADQLRDVTIKTHCNPYAEGSCLVMFGNTHVICTASVDEGVPPFLRGSGTGWITAEYGMIPRSTHTRKRRTSSSGQSDGRTHEIQRFIGRALRSTIDLAKLGERQIIIDCDVVQADGGTRTAAITGSYVSLVVAVNKLLKNRVIKKDPLLHHIAAVSCGILNGNVIVDLDYSEDSKADVDANFVMTESGHLIEVQSTAEISPFTTEQLTKMLELSRNSISQLIEIQKKALSDL